jgi:hypothetical protein
MCYLVFLPQCIQQLQQFDKGKKKDKNPLFRAIDTALHYPVMSEYRTYYLCDCSKDFVIWLLFVTFERIVQAAADVQKMPKYMDTPDASLPLAATLEGENLVIIARKL